MYKKGIFLPTLFIFTIIVFSWAYYVLAIKGVEGVDESEKKIVGEAAQHIIAKDHAAEYDLFYIDQSARLAAYEAVYILGQNGGYAIEPHCGSYQGYSLWVRGNEECYPSKFADAFKPLFEDTFALYLDKPGLPKREYTISIDQTEDLTIIGKDEDMLSFNDAEIQYSVTSDFREVIDYTFADYTEIELALVDMIEQCKTADCFRQYVDSSWLIQEHDGSILFDINTGKKLLDKDIIIKFGLQLEA